MKISIIICTRNRAAGLTPSLDSVVKAIGKAKPVDAEIVVVNNGSTDATDTVLAAWAAGVSVPVQIISEPRKGLSRARNAGLAAAKGDLILFTDDDCQYDETYIVNTLAHYATDTRPVMRGGSVVLGDPTDLPIGILTDPDIIRWNIATLDAKRRNLTSKSLLGCNMVLPRSLINTIGLFDTRLGAGTPLFGGEDIDYILRAYLSGATVEYQPDMRIHHFHGRKTMEQGRTLSLSYFLSAGALYAKYLFIYPDFSKPFYWDIKKMIKDILKHQNNFMPDISLTFTDLVKQNIKGIIAFYLITLTSKDR